MINYRPTLCTLDQINSQGSHHIQRQLLSATIVLFTTTDFSHTYVAGSGPSKIRRLPYLILMLWRWIRSMSFSSCVYMSPYVSSQRISHAQQGRVWCFCWGVWLGEQLEIRIRWCSTQTRSIRTFDTCQNLALRIHLRLNFPTY